ncbi:MAG: FAD-dependent monooxygenase, partial [Pseudomonadota bacterium]
MRAAIIGGGPAGLYFAILLKKSHPDSEITVFERNRLEDTFGFGVVFSDQTLDNFEAADPESYARITDEFAYWDDVEIRYKGEVHRVGGNGFCGFARTTLLRILSERAGELGVEQRFETEVESVDELMADYDLVVLGDGINSKARDRFVDHFQPVTDLRPNKFVWLGSDCPLDAFTFSFRETEAGIFIAHAYQYEEGRSTWVMECTDETWRRAGIDKMSEDESKRFLEGVFAEDLGGHGLITNRSLWRNFPMIRNARWVKDNAVLLGDAKATAHFSIGSGTKLAMEDAIALHQAVAGKIDLKAALEGFETGRREEVEKTQHAADVSLVWFEHVERFWGFDPVQF